MTFFTLPTNYSVTLHQQIFSLIYNSNGGFNWNDVYFMPIKLREFYWKELVKAKDAESAVYDKAIKNNTKTSGRTSRR